MAETTHNYDIRRLGRGKHWIIGEYVAAELRTWEGPVEAGQEGYEVWTPLLFPRDQWRHAMHPRQPTGYNLINGRSRSSVAPSCRFYGELCRYGNFRWEKPSHGR